MKSSRREKIIEIANQRQSDVCVVMENVVDPHNIGAIVRTCDAVGIHQVYLIYNSHSLIPKKLKVGKLTSGGARKWVDVKMLGTWKEGASYLKESYHRVLGCHVHRKSQLLLNADLTGPAAIVMGGEKSGLSDSALHECTGFIHIPMMGMVESLNVSVACGVVLYELYRQRSLEDRYDARFSSLQEDYLDRSRNQHRGDQIL